MLTRLFAMLVLMGFHSVLTATEWKPFLLEDGHVKVAVIVEGIKGYAVLDSGSPRSGINKAFIEANELATEVLTYGDITGLFDKKRRPLIENVSVQLNERKLRLNLAEVSFGPPRNAILLGSNFLQDYVVDIDYPNQRFRLHERDRFNINQIANITATKKRDSGELIVRLSLNDEDNRWVVLDTGHSGGVLLEKRVAAQNDWFNRFRSRLVLVQGVNSMGYHHVIKLPVVGAGPHRVLDVDVEFPDHNKINHLTSQQRKLGTRIRSRRVEGIVGYELLKEFRLVFDYSAGKVALIKPSN